VTVVVGFVGADGAVMSSDTEATESLHTRLEVEKIWTSGGVLMGYTGTSSVRQPLAAAIDQAIETHFGTDAEIDRWQARSALRQAARPVLEDCYNHHVGLRDAHGIPEALKGILLVIGREAQGYWMLELDPMLQGTFYTEAGFHTVGSGAAAAYMAQSMMKDYDAAGRGVAHLKLIAHRIVKTCIDTLGGPMMVGGDVAIWCSQDGSSFAKVPADEMEAIASGVAEWRGIERESLDKVVVPSGAAEKVEEEAVPLPEAIDADGERAGTESRVAVEAEPPQENL
jgi:20S proteasome alpha/beta subunit